MAGVEQDVSARNQRMIAVLLILGMGVIAVILANLPEAERERVLTTASFRRFTDRTITDPVQLRELLDQDLPQIVVIIYKQNGPRRHPSSCRREPRHWRACV